MQKARAVAVGIKGGIGRAFAGRGECGRQRLTSLASIFGEQKRNRPILILISMSSVKPDMTVKTAEAFFLSGMAAGRHRALRVLPTHQKALQGREATLATS